MHALAWSVYEELILVVLFLSLRSPRNDLGRDLGIVKSAAEFDEKMRVENHHRWKRSSAYRSLAKLHWLMTVITDEIKLVPRAFCRPIFLAAKTWFKRRGRIKQFFSRIKPALYSQCWIVETLQTSSLFLAQCGNTSEHDFIGWKFGKFVGAIKSWVNGQCNVAVASKDEEHFGSRAAKI